MTTAPNTGMLTPEEARSLARKALARGHRNWTLTKDPVPMPIWSAGLKPPTERTVLADLSRAQEWARKWHHVRLPAGIEVRWEERTWRSVGRQRVPVRISAASPDALVSWVGGAEAQQQRLFARRCAILQARAEQWRTERTIVGLLRMHAARLTRLSEADFTAVVEVLDWLQHNEVRGLRPRQLPIRGVDSKWFGVHRSLLEAFAPHPRNAGMPNDGASPGSLGVLDTHRTVRMRILDPALRPARLKDLEMPVDQAAEWNLRPQHVLIVENSETLLCLPDASESVALWGRGYDTAILQLPWLQGAQLTYWGDLDSQGFAILHRYRTHLPKLDSILMDVDTLENCADLWVTEPTPARGAFNTLTSSEVRALERLREAGDVRLEQERIPWARALEELRRRLPVNG